MTPEDAFLEDILDHPSDDTPRLVYADWLTDRGERDDEARAEFIRTQCRLARLDPRLEQRRLLEARHNLLLHWHESRWLPAGWRSPDQGRWERGFFRVKTRWWPFFTWGESWFRHPAVLEAEVEIRGGGDGGFLTIDDEHVRFLGQTPLLARVRRLSVRGRRHPDMPNRGDDVIRALVGSLHARRLEFLDVSCLSDAGARALIASPYLTALQGITLWAHVELSAEVLARLEKRFPILPW